MNSFWNSWNGLTPTAREGIIVCLIAMVIGGLIVSLFTGFGKLLVKSAVGILKLIQRLLNWIRPPAPGRKPTEEASEIKLYGESLEIEKRPGNQSGVALSLHGSAALAVIEGELGEARRLFNESLEITNGLGDKSDLALIFYNLGVLEEKEGNKAEVARLFREVLSIFERVRAPDAELARRGLAKAEGKSSRR